MILVILVGLLMGWATHHQRVKRQMFRVLNQDNTVRSAEVNYRNAGLVREAAEAAIARYEGENGGKDESPSLRTLRAEARKARQTELDREAIWKEEKDTLSRLIREVYDSWY
jgi:hypothetical protein